MKTMVKYFLAILTIFLLRNDLFGQTVTGSGSVNQLSKFTGTSAIGNSLFFDNGSGAAIGTTDLTDPSSRDLSLKISATNVSGSQPLPGIVLEGKTGWYTNPRWELILGANSHYSRFSIMDGTNNRLMINENGNVLIAKTSQSANYRLDVAGGIRADSVVVNTTGADFVFDEDYQKMSLDSLAGYVAEHKHLPDISSADRMWKDGVNVGTLQTKLLQKVEELTLYVIEQNKRIERLEKENATLRNRQ